jgi:hypothetical protein
MVHSRKSENWKKVGYVGVDSGNLILTDPVYMKKDLPTYEELVGLKKSSKVKGDMTKEVGEGIALVTETGFGDGSYPVYAKISDEGRFGKRVSEIKVKFI